MRLHIFNPEHDIALAHNDPYFTAPRAGRMLREDCGYIPALWASGDDRVLVSSAKKADFLHSPGLTDEEKCRLVTPNELKTLPLSEICPWGWDSALVHQLTKAGVGRHIMPAEEALGEIRRLSSREFAAMCLTKLAERHPLYVGEARAAHSLEEAERLLQERSVVKEPWSSSGRGVRFVENALTDAQKNWVKKVLERQGTIMVESLYDKIADFGMEFEATEKGVSYRGLSVFDTVNGAYTGNMLASEGAKMASLNHPELAPLIADTARAICQLLSSHLTDVYRGPLGVDMMIVKTRDGLRLHPMVEINLRRTMGHVAIDLYEKGKRGHMKIDFTDGHYSFVTSD